MPMEWLVMEEKETYTTEQFVRNTTPVVDAIAQINFEGNIVPPSWFEHIRKNDRANLTAVNILSDICYWYRPTYRRDERTGELVAIVKKFKSDMLQRSYEDWANMFGQSKDTIKSATDLLIELGLVKKQARNIVVNGMKLSNVLFWEPIPDKVVDITYRTQVGYKKHRKNSEIEIPPQGGGKNTPQVGGSKWHTYTETITETSTLLPEGKKEQEELEKQAIAEFQALPSASANTEPISISKQAIAKINQFLPYSKVSKFQRQEINRYCANDPKLLALESALGELLARRDQYGFMNVNMVLTFWGNKLNAQASATGVPDYYSALKAKQLEEKAREKDAAVNRVRASDSSQPGNGAVLFGVAAPGR